MPPYLKLYYLTDITLSARDRGNYSVPDFAVHAASPDEAADKCSGIVLCDRRATDGILWTLAFRCKSLSGDESVYVEVRMQPDEGSIRLQRPTTRGA
jgi:hypothetical protein